MVRNGLHVISGYKGGEENEEGVGNFESKREKVGSFGITKRESKVRHFVREKRKREEKKRKE